MATNTWKIFVFTSSGCKKTVDLDAYITAIAESVVSTDSWEWITITVSAPVSTITSDYLKGDLSPIIYFNGSANLWEDNDITHNSSAGTLTLPGSMGDFEGKLTFQYKNLS